MGVFAVIGLYFACFSLGANAFALSPSARPISGGSTKVSVTIQPVRLILVNNQGKIVRMISNTSSDVPPTVYKNSFNSPPVAISPDIRQQYWAILAKADTTQTGTVYQAGPSFLSRLERLASYQSILFRAH